MNLNKNLSSVKLYANEISMLGNMGDEKELRG